MRVHTIGASRSPPPRCLHKCALTARGQVAAAAPMQTGAALASVGVEHTAELQFSQTHYLSEAAALVLEGQLVLIEHHGVQTALEATEDLRDARVCQAANVIRLHQSTKEDGTVCA